MIASALFYLSYDPRYSLFLIGFALFSFFAAQWIEKSEKNGKWLYLSILTICAVWFAIKVLPWFLREVSAGKTTVAWLMPVGISYYLLQAISYMTDVQRGKISAEKSFWKYFLFLSYFPAVVQGPISRYDILIPQLLHSKPFEEHTFRKGILLVLFGLVKKLVIADRLSILANYCFDEYAQLQGFILYLGAVGYAFQIYTDFSGCVDICRGVSSLFGISLIPNFNRPYLALSIKEFWNRWHLSLSNWLRDYVYIPLDGNRKGKIQKYENLLVTFAVSGIWHGAGTQYILWGIMNAVYQIVGELTAKWRIGLKEKWHILPQSYCETFFQRLITFHLTILAWIVFRSGTVTDAFGYIFQMIYVPGLNTLMETSGTIGGLHGSEIALLLAHIVTLLRIEVKTPNQDSALNAVNGLHIILRWSVYVILILDVLLFGVYGSGYDLSGFLYGGF